MPKAPGNNTNTFARESHIDSLAAKIGMDPLKFRLQHLTDKKMLRVLKATADKFGWKRAKTTNGLGHGVACGIDAGTYVATMAEVEVDKTTGHVQVKRLVCAQDMGLVVNPEGATLQMEGCMTMGLGYALKEHIRFKNGAIFDLNFDTYEIPRFSWLPSLETLLIDDKDAEPQGGGEPAIITMGAVIANAIYDAIGVRLLQLPLSPASTRGSGETVRHSLFIVRSSDVAPSSTALLIKQLVHSREKFFRSMIPFLWSPTCLFIL